MNELKVIEILKNEIGFSDLSIKKLKKFHNYLLEYNKSYNLISKNRWSHASCSYNNSFTHKKIKN